MILCLNDMGILNNNVNGIEATAECAVRIGENTFDLCKKIICSNYRNVFLFIELFSVRITEMRRIDNSAECGTSYVCLLFDLAMVI